MAAGKMAYREFATPLPADGPLEAAANIFGQVARIVVNSPDFTDNASVNLVRFQARLNVFCSVD